MRKIIFSLLLISATGFLSAQDYFENFEGCGIIVNQEHPFNDAEPTGSLPCVTEWLVGSGSPGIYVNFAGITHCNGAFGYLGYCGATAQNESLVLSYNFLSGTTYTVSLAMRNATANNLTVNFWVINQPVISTCVAGNGCSAIPATPAGSTLVNTQNMTAVNAWQVFTFTIPASTLACGNNGLFINVTSTSGADGALLFDDLSILQEGIAGNGCAVPNYIPKVGTPGPTQVCSDIYEDNNRNVGMGTLGNGLLFQGPQTKLHVNGQSLWLSGGNGTGLGPLCGPGLRMYFDVANAYGAIFSYSYGLFGSSPRNLMIQQPGGAVGIGVPGIGNFWYTQNPQLQGNNQAPTSGWLRLDVNGVTRGLGYLATSDSRFKKDVKPITKALDKVLKLNGVTYSWNREKFPEKNFDNLIQAGFLAQEVDKVYPEAVVRDSQGYYSMNYNALIPLLTEAIKEVEHKVKPNEELAEKAKEQDAKIADMNKQLAEQNKQIADLKSLVNDICNLGCEGLRGSNLSNPNGEVVLYQSIPNPTSGAAVISYFLNISFNSAFIRIADMNGIVVKEYKITQQGKGSVIFEGSGLSDSAYKYSLYVDGKLYDTKSIVITKN